MRASPDCPAVPRHRPAGAGCAENTPRSGLPTGVPHVLNAKNFLRYRTRRFLSGSQCSRRGGSPESAASPAVPNDNAAPTHASVPPRMAGLIAGYRWCAAALAAIDDAADPAAWEAAGEVACRAPETPPGHLGRAAPGLPRRAPADAFDP